MNRKDFEEIGRSIKMLPPDIRRRVAVLFADTFEDCHSNFNRERFLKACGVETEKAP